MISGKTFLHYKILERVGAGGMGVVYEADDTRLGRRVALKFLSDALNQDPYALQRFKQEARSASALNHPNICTIFAIEECDGHNFIVMELLEGRSLSEMINGHALKLDQIVDIGIQLTDALDVAHSKGIVHRDLKPGNVFITTRGQAKILDFGLAKLTHDRQAAMETVAGNAATAAPVHLTSPGTAVGTVAYMSPEQARGEDLDGRSDLFSMGSVLYEMATGRIPFEGNTTAVIFQGILDRNPPPPFELNPDINPRLEEIVSKSLEKDRDLRYQTAAEMRGDLKRLKRDTSSGFRGAGSTSGFTNAASGSTTVISAAPLSGSHQHASSSGAVLLETAKQHKAGTGIITLVSALMIAFGLYGVYTMLHRDAGPTAFRNMSMEKFTSSGKDLVATISPDGKYVVHVMNEAEGKQSLWMRHVVTGSNTRIMEAIEAQYFGVTFSPDGNFLYFVRREPANPGLGFLYQIPVLGGTPHKVVEDVDSAISFAPDGQHFVFLRNSSSEANSKLVIANLDGSGERVLAKLPLPGYNDPAWSPDGKWIAATVTDPGGTSLGRVVLLNPSNGKEKTLFGAAALLNKPAWMPDSKSLAFIFHDPSTNWEGQIAALSVPGGKFRRITNDLNSYSSLTLAITSDGKRMVATQLTHEAGLYILDAEGNGVPAQIDSHGNTGAAWLPDGRLLSSDYDGHIATMNADGTNRSVVFERRFPISGVSACPDGVHALFSMGNKETNGLSIWRLNLQDGRAAPITKGKADQTPVCAPDSTWFIFETLQNGKKVLMRMPIDGGEAKQVVDKFVEVATISPDGRQVAVLAVEGAGTNTRAVIQIIPSEGGAPLKTVPLSSSISGLFQYSADGQSLYYPVLQRGIGNLLKQDFAGGTPSPVTQFKDLTIYGFQYDWNRKKLAIARGRSLTDVVLITQQQAPAE